VGIHKSYVIAAPRVAVWAALTEPTVIERWGGGPAVMSTEPGFEFEFWGGDVHGTLLEVDPGVSMLQEWYSGDWDAPSLATFTLSDEPSGGTRLELDNTGVPDSEAADVDSGWDEYYLGPIKALLEANAG
jgi:uncharacterized protein YndB with AHSA1/START domain